MKLVSVKEMQAIEAEADANGLSYDLMMHNAGCSLARHVHALYAEVTNKTVLALVGSGNNGGDALVALAELLRLGWQAAAYIVRARPENDILTEQVRSAGGAVHLLADDRGFEQLGALLRSNQVLLDGVLGTGVRLPLKAEIADLFLFGRDARLALNHRLHIVAVDCPSGVDCDSGEAAAECLPAEVTVTMAAVKQGLLKLPAAGLVGELLLGRIGPLDELHAWKAISRQVIDREWVRSVLPARPLDSHKGTFGAALIVAGSVNYIGAALLAGQAAYRSGAGLVTMGVPEPLYAILAGQFPEATWLLLPEAMGVLAAPAAAVVQHNLSRATALLVGPGFGMEDTTRDFIERLLTKSAAKNPTLGFAPQRTAKPELYPGLPPLVVDADGLKLLSRIKDWPQRLPAETILTPHPGEMAALTGLPKDELLLDRPAIAERFARQWGHVVVFKGAFTVIAAPDGTLGVIPVATPALARAGTGDVLAGIITGLRAQGLDAFQAAAAGAWIHGRAGLAAARKLGSTASVLAGDVLMAIPAVMAELETL